jgi:rhodanese-related sulfurtransferase
MKWKQFFTPVKSIDSQQGREMLAAAKADEVTVLDVRQPNEYAAGHLPGAKLIPLPELSDRLKEIDPEKPTLVY